MLRMNIQLFAHKKGVGSTKNGRDSESKRLGVKRADGQFVLAGNILIGGRVFRGGSFYHPMIVIIGHGIPHRFIAACYDLPDEKRMGGSFRGGNHFAEIPAANILFNNGETFFQNAVPHIGKLICVPAGRETQSPDHCAGSIL